MPQRHPGQLAGLGLAVAVADVETRGLMERAQDLWVERLSGCDEAAQCRQRLYLGSLGDDPILGRGHAKHVDRFRGQDLESLVWVKARVVQKRRGPTDPGRDEYVASRLRPPAGRRTPDQLARPGIEPVLSLEPLT